MSKPAFIVSRVILPFMLGGAVTAGVAFLTDQARNGSAQPQEKEPAPASLVQTETMQGPYSIMNPPQLLRDILNEADKPRRVFNTEVPGIQGWVVVNEDRPTEPQIIYTFPNGTHGFAGAMFGFTENGKVDNLTPGHVKDYAPSMDLNPLWSDLEKTTWFAEGAKDGQATKTIYGFFDANCIYCHLSWLAFEPYMAAGLQIRWIPVAILGPSSAGKAAALFDAKDPSAVMRAGHLGWDSLGKDVAFQEVKVSKENEVVLDSNRAMMTKMGARGTPAFVYKDEGGNVQLVPGMPKLTDIPGITGMAHIENKNPKLDQFR